MCEACAPGFINEPLISLPALKAALTPYTHNSLIFFVSCLFSRNKTQ